MSNTTVTFSSELTPTLDIGNEPGGGSGGGGGFSFSSLLGPIIRPRVDVTVNEGGISASFSHAPYGDPVPGRLLIILIILAVIFFVLIPRKKKGV